MGWHEQGNTLALVEVMERFAYQFPDVTARMNSGLIGTARSMGMNEDQIRAAFEDNDRSLVIYEP